MKRLDHGLLTGSAEAALLLRDLSGDLETREAVPRPATWDATARTIEAVIATDNPVARRDQSGDYDEVLDPATLDLASARGVSVLDAHQTGGVNTVIGVVEDVRREGSEIVARIRFSDRPEVQAVVGDIATGIIRSLSIGYRVAEWRDGQANGRRTRTAAKWSIHEVSFVPVPADPRARTRGLPANDRTDINRHIRTLGDNARVGQTVINDLIDRGATLAEATTAIMADMITRSTPIRTAHNAGTMDNPAALVRALGDALYHRVAPSFTPSPQARAFLGLSIRDAAAECLRASGVATTGLGAAEIVTRALNTTSDFPNLLGDVLGRTLREPYAAPASGIRQLAREASAPDFRTRHRIQFDASGVELRKVNEHGEFQSGSPLEGKESYKLDTFGRIVGFSRQALINDDLGGLADIGRRLSQNALAFEAQFLVDLLVSNAGLGPVLSDTKALFHVDHGNLDGTPAAPAEGPLSLARLAMRRQTGLAGSLITVTPRFILAPPELETTFEKLLATIAAAKTDDVAAFAGKLTLIIEPRLVDPLRWYMVAAPAEIDGLEFAYLSGAPGPQIETQAGFRVDGVETKVRLDYGAGFVDHRGWYTNTGLAPGG